MRKILYEGKHEGIYITSNFFVLMEKLWPDSLVLNKTFPKYPNPSTSSPIPPNPNSLPKINQVVNVWHPEEVVVLYFKIQKYSWKDPTQKEGNSILAKVVLDGKPAKLSKVEKKILEGINLNLHK